MGQFGAKISDAIWGTSHRLSQRFCHWSLLPQLAMKERQFGLQFSHCR